MNKKVIAVALALAVLLGVLLMMLNKAEAATVGTYANKYRIVFYTTNYKIYEYLKDMGFNIVYKGELPKPTPQPQQPKPDQPSPEPVNSLTADEQKMVNLVNQERAAAGLKPLQVDLTLTKLARIKSQDMIDKNYFSHTSPTYGSPFDMMKKYGVTYRYAGENLAGAWSVEVAHTNLMNSPGHRANILNPNYTHIGIGAIKGGPYGRMFTQEFVGK